MTARTTLYILKVTFKCMWLKFYRELKWPSVPLKVLGISEKPGGVSDELNEVHHLPHLPPLPLHRRLRTPWNATLRRQVSPSGVF